MLNTLHIGERTKAIIGREQKVHNPLISELTSTIQRTAWGGVQTFFVLQASCPPYYIELWHHPCVTRRTSIWSYIIIQAAARLNSCFTIECSGTKKTYQNCEMKTSGNSTSFRMVQSFFYTHCCSVIDTAAVLLTMKLSTVYHVFILLLLHGSQFSQQREVDMDFL